MRRPNRGRSTALDRLLDEDVADGTALCQVLAAARAPGTADELVGLPAAMSAFATATREVPRSPVRHRAAPPSRVTAGGLLTRTLAAVSGVALAGGVAYAATTVGFIGTGGSSNHPPASHSTSPGHSGKTGRSGGSLPYEPADPGSVVTRGVVASTTVPPGQSTGHGGPDKVQPNRPGTTHPSARAHPTHAASPKHPTHPPSPTHPAPSANTTPPAHGRTSHPAHPPAPTHPAPPTHSPDNTP